MSKTYESAPSLRYGLSFLAAWCLTMLLVGCQPATVDVKVTMKAAEQAEQPAAKEASESQPAEPAAAASGFGDIAGQIILDGDAPTLALLVKKGDASAKDPAVCAAEDIPDDSIVVNSKTKGLANVCIFLAKAPKTIAPELKTSTVKEVIFDQKYCRFFPHVIMVRTDQTVLVKSDDTVSHNTHTFPDRNPQINTTINPGERKGVPFQVKMAERKPAQVKCDIHPWMKAYWMILDHPYGAVTDADGKFTIKGLPAGNHELVVWHEVGGILERAMKVAVKVGANELPVIKVAAAKLK